MKNDGVLATHSFLCNSKSSVTYLKHLKLLWQSVINNGTVITHCSFNMVKIPPVSSTSQIFFIRYCPLKLFNFVLADTALLIGNLSRSKASNDNAEEDRSLPPGGSPLGK